MKTTYYLSLIILLFYLSACQWSGKSGQLNLNDSIALYEKEIYNPDQDTLNRKKAKTLIGLYEQFAAQNPQDKKTPEILFKAAELSINVQNPNKTIMLYDELLLNYPDFEKAKAVLFLKAFVYDDQLKDYANAKKYYEEFLIKYPNSEFADDAEISLKNLGKTPEEMIREFEKNNP